MSSFNWVRVSRSSSNMTHVFRMWTTRGDERLVSDLDENLPVISRVRSFLGESGAKHGTTALLWYSLLLLHQWKYTRYSYIYCWFPFYWIFGILTEIPLFFVVLFSGSNCSKGRLWNNISTVVRFQRTWSCFVTWVIDELSWESQFSLHQPSIGCQLAKEVLSPDTSDRRSDNIFVTDD